MITHSPDTEELLRRTGAGDASARQQLLTRHRDRLRRMVAVRLDPRLAARVDPSDVVQEALIEADRKLDGYLQERPVAYYPWLRQLAWERLVKLHERHVLARKRSVLREEPGGLALPDDSAVLLARRLAGTGTSPSHGLLRQELRERVRAALARLSPADREVLVLRYLEQLPTADIAAVLAVGEGAVKMRHRRALDRLSRLLAEGEDQS
ncbi:MAG TPA: sigma-70 family RNA polymerase sigma factor [Gemmataceae bacterium]|jgi:RNA polymerase sigma-70 factor (ECF subfamily)